MSAPDNELRDGRGRTVEELLARPRRPGPSLLTARELRNKTRPGPRQRQKPAKKWRHGVPPENYPWPAVWDGPCVYFIRAASGGNIKIGRAKDVELRLKELQACSPERLKVLTVIQTTRPDVIERALHRKLKAHRAHGEWFRPHADVLRALEVASEFYDQDHDVWGWELEAPRLVQALGLEVRS